MALAYVTKTSLTPVLCSPGSEMVPGDQVRLALDTAVDPELPVSILGVVQNPVARLRLIDPTTGCAVSGYSYTIAFDPADLNGAMVDLTADLIISMGCVTCCELLTEAVAEKAPLVHTHVSAAITDASASGAPDKVAKYDPSGFLIAAGFYNTGGSSLLGNFLTLKKEGNDYQVDIFWDGSATENREVGIPDATGVLPVVPAFADLTAANAALASGKFFWNTTVGELQQATA